MPYENIVYSTWSFQLWSSTAIFIFFFQKKRKAAAAASESAEVGMEDTGSPKKRKTATSSKSKDCSDSHM